MESAKKLFLFNAYYDPAIFFDTEFERSEISDQKKIVVLAFEYDRDEMDLLEKYKGQSINLTDRGAETQDRLKKIVHFFSKRPQPIRNPSLEVDGLDENYQREIEYIIGPYAHFFPPSQKLINTIWINSDLTQLCIRCDFLHKMRLDFEEILQKKIFVLEVDDSEISEIGKT